MCAVIYYSSGHANFDKLYHFLLNNITTIDKIDHTFIFNNDNLTSTVLGEYEFLMLN